MIGLGPEHRLLVIPFSGDHSEGPVVYRLQNRVLYSGVVIHKYAKGPFAVDWEDRYDFAELRRERVAKAQAALSDSGVDAVGAFEKHPYRFQQWPRGAHADGSRLSLR